MKVHSVAL